MIKAFIKIFIKEINYLHIIKIITTKKLKNFFFTLKDHFFKKKKKVYIYI